MRKSRRQPPRREDVSSIRNLSSAPNSRQELWICLALFFSILAVYAGVRNFDFINYDDPFYISQNPNLRSGMTPAAIGWALTSGEGANWFPVTRLSNLLDIQFFGLQSGWHHFNNAVIHAMTTWLLFAFLFRATGARWASAWVALLFGLHPLHVESVAWVSERKDVLCAAFWMLALWGYVRYAERPDWSRYLFVIVAFCLGLMSKAMIVSFPVLLLLLDGWPLARYKTVSRKQLLIEKMPFFVLSAVAAVVTYMVQQASGAVRTFSAFPLGSRIENALLSCVIYAAKFVLPTNLSVFYPYRADIPLWQALLAGLALLTISIFAVRAFPSRPYMAVGWFWYLVTLLPVLGIVQVGGQARADRYMYVPMIGLAVMAAWFGADLQARRPRMKPLTGAAAAATCLACALVTWVQVQYWRNSERLFQHAVDVTEGNSMAHHQLGNALLEVPGRLSDAISHLQTAVRIDPNSASAHSDLGSAFFKLPGHLPDAIAEYRAALRINPEMPIPHANLGSALTKVPGSLPEAIAECETAVRLDPDLADARNYLGSALAKAGRLPEAVTQFETAIRLDDRNPEFRNNLGMALAAMPGRARDAIAAYEMALSLKPDYQEARNNLGAAMANDPAQLRDAIAQYETVLKRDSGSSSGSGDTEYNLALALAKTPGRLPDAIAHFEAALRLNPGNAEAHNNLGFALTSFPARLNEAVAHFQAALRINPDYADAHYNLGVALANQGRMAEGIRHLEAAERLRPDPELEQLLKRLKAGG